MCRANISIETSEVLRRNRKVDLAAEDGAVTRWSWPPCNCTPSACKGGIRTLRAYLPLWVRRVTVSSLRPLMRPLISYSLHRAH